MKKKIALQKIEEKPYIDLGILNMQACVAQVTENEDLNLVPVRYPLVGNGCASS